MIIRIVPSIIDWEEVRMQLATDVIILLCFAGICGLVNWALLVPYEQTLEREREPNSSFIEYLRPTIAFWLILIISVVCVWYSWNFIGLPIPEFIKTEFNL